MPLKLLIADDAPDVTEVVAFGARFAWPDCIIYTAVGGQTALDQFAQEPVDLVVLDVEMPPPDGFEVCRRIRAASAVPILMLTVREAPLDKVRALELGADDYLTKPFNHLELMARMRALIRRARTTTTLPTSPSTEQASPSSAVVVIGDLSLDYAAQEVCVGSERILLTSTEYRLLEYMVRNAGTLLSHRQLLEHVWGPEYVGETHYLKVFVQRLRQKLHDNPQFARYIHTDWGRGYRFTSAPEQQSSPS